MPDYPIVQVRPEDVVGDEGMGSKPKFWFKRGAEHWLFKEARDSTGEDWAEKVVAEVARVAEIPAATVELAEFKGRRGCACLSFTPSNAETLIHGNEILAGHVLGYDPKKTFHQSDHTLENIVKALKTMFPDAAEHDGVLANLGTYLVLDALVGNTDRHHENWGILTRSKALEGGAIELTMEVAPSFDHASSLGRELLDDGRQQYLAQGRVPNYVRRGRGAIFQSTTDRRGVNPLSLVEIGMQTHPGYFAPALQRLGEVQLARLQATVDDVPVIRMSDSAKNFAKAFMAYTHQVLTKQVP